MRSCAYGISSVGENRRDILTRRGPFDEELARHRRRLGRLLAQHVHAHAHAYASTSERREASALRYPIERRWAQLSGSQGLWGVEERIGDAKSVVPEQITNQASFAGWVSTTATGERRSRFASRTGPVRPPICKAAPASRTNVRA